jgi:Hypothetical protein (DUF2513)
MKRDMDLIRLILMRIEEHNEASDVPPAENERQTIGYHLRLMTEAGLIDGVDVEEDHVTGEIIWFLKPVPRLTWAGHEFLDAARNDTVWKEAKKKAGGAFGSISFAVLTQLLMQVAKQHLGMP